MQLTTIKLQELPHPSIIIATGAQCPVVTLSPHTALLYVVPKGDPKELAQVLMDHARENFATAQHRMVYWTTCRTTQEAAALREALGFFVAVLEVQADGTVIQHRNETVLGHEESWRYAFQVTGVE